jgi:hypothetical protein
LPDPPYIETLRAVSPWLGRADRLVSIKLRPLDSDGFDAYMAICVPHPTAGPDATALDESAEMLGFVDPRHVRHEQIPGEVLPTASTLYDVEGTHCSWCDTRPGPS